MEEKKMVKIMIKITRCIPSLLLAGLLFGVFAKPAIANPGNSQGQCKPADAAAILAAEKKATVTEREAAGLEAAAAKATGAKKADAEPKAQHAREEADAARAELAKLKCETTSSSARPCKPGEPLAIRYAEEKAAALERNA